MKGFQIYFMGVARMSELQVGKVIYKLRKDNRKTQEELANFLSVSTAAVSKWESGVSQTKGY